MTSGSNKSTTHSAKPSPIAFSVKAGPFTSPAAVALNASIPATTMAVAMGEEVANMLQPFWALPVVAIAGIGIQRVLGFTVLTFAVSAIAYGAALPVLVQ